MPIAAEQAAASIAIIAAVSSVATAGIAGLVAWLNGKSKNEVEESTTLFGAYHTVVENLQEEIARLHNELIQIHSDMERCHDNNQALKAEIEYLKSCVVRIDQTTSDIEAFMTAEHPPLLDE